MGGVLNSFHLQRIGGGTDLGMAEAGDVCAPHRPGADGRSRIAFRLLGPFEVVVGGRPVDVGPGKLRSLLAALLARPNELTRSEWLTAAVWGSHPPSTARATLRSHVLRLRRALCGEARTCEVIRTRPGGYLLEVDEQNLDLLLFQRLASRAQQAGDSEGEARALRSALALWRGPAFSGVESDLLHLEEAPRLNELWLQLVERRVDLDLAAGRADGLVSELIGLTAAHPHRERLWAQLMEALYAVGRQAEALAAYRRVHRLLADDLGLGPGRALRLLEQRILRGEPTGSALPARITCQDMTPAQDPVRTRRPGGLSPGRREPSLQTAAIPTHERDARISVTLIDGHPATLSGIQAWLAGAEPRIQVVATGQSARAAWLPPGDAADVVVLDLKARPAASYADLRRLARHGRRLVIYTDVETSAAARACLDLGAATVVSKSEGASVLIAAIAAVSRDLPYLSPALTATLAARPIPGRPLLSDRERQVLLAWLRCDSKILVARELRITVRTVGTYVDRIRLKYAAAGRPAPTKAGLLARALQDGLLDLDDL